jgi:hypothetical protein
MSSNRNKLRSRQNAELPLATQLSQALSPANNAVQFEEAAQPVAGESVPTATTTAPGEFDVMGALREHGERMSIDLENETAENDDPAHQDEANPGDPNQEETDDAATEDDQPDGDEAGGDDELDVDPAVVERNSDEAEHREHVPPANEFDYGTFGVEHNLPPYWSKAHVDQWIASGGSVIPRTELGSIVNDPTRVERPISGWDQEEVLDGLHDRLVGIDEAHYSDLARRYRQLVNVAPAWSSREVLDHVQQGILPPQTTSGVWINDVTRARRPARDWSTPELEAWANGQIRAIGEATEMKLGIELNQRMELGVPTQDTPTILNAYKRMETGAIKTAPATITQSKQPETIQGLTKVNVSYIQHNLEDYKTAVGPGVRHTPEKGITAQKQLDGVFRHILQLQSAEGFCSGMTILRDFVKANRETMFDPTPAFRYTGALRKEGDLQETHINLLTLLYVYTDVNTAARRQLDLQWMVSKFPADRQAWLIEFFTRYC